MQQNTLPYLEVKLLVDHRDPVWNLYPGPHHYRRHYHHQPVAVAGDCGVVGRGAACCSPPGNLFTTEKDSTRSEECERRTQSKLE
mgnify:CR=1 FL=1